jgi:hypothetical protein
VEVDLEGGRIDWNGLAGDGGIGHWRTNRSCRLGMDELIGTHRVARNWNGG